MSPTSRASQKKPQRRFQFIDNSAVGATNANSTQVRRHVMQEYMREKRWESRAKAEEEVSDPSIQPSPRKSNATSLSRRSPPQPPPKDLPSTQNVTRFKSRLASVVPVSQRAALSSHADEIQRPLPPSNPPDQVLVAKVRDIQQELTPVSRKEIRRPHRGFYLTPQSFASIADVTDVPPLTPSSATTAGDGPSPTSLSPPPSIPTGNQKISLSPKPLTSLSAARTDPFDCLPMVLTKQDQELFDFYATVMPACSYGFERRHARAHNWYLSVFIPEAMKSSVAFQNTILVHAANTQAWVRGLPETTLAIEHRARASEMLSDHFQKNPYDTSDAAISSTISAAALEDFDPRIERRTYAWVHWNAAVKKIRDRGGPAALEQNKSLRMLINWSDYILSGYNGYGSTFYFDHKNSTQHHSDIEAETLGRQELQQQCEEFIVFLKCSESLALVAANLQGNMKAQEKRSLRYTAFEHDQPLYRLLASSNSSRYTQTGQLKQIISRLAALMSINVAIWEYRYSAAASEDFLRELIANIKYNDLDQHISVEALIQVLLSGSSNIELVHTERPWLVGRLLKVAKRLSRSSWERLNDFLLHCLTLGSSLKPVMQMWEHELRAEILSAPLVSHVLPLMQP